MSTHQQQERKGRTQPARKGPDKNRNRQTSGQRNQSGPDGEQGISRHGQSRPGEDVPDSRERQAEQASERPPSEEL